MATVAMHTSIPFSFPGNFEEIYKDHYRRVYCLCLRMCADPSLAEDLAQEVFITVARKLASFRGDSMFTTWIHRITINVVLMRFRKRQVKLEAVTVDGKLPDIVDPDTINSERIVDRIALDRAIAQLPKGYRAVVVLHDVEGYEHEEIAKILGCSAGTSKSQLHKARKRLRRLLQQVA